MCLFVSPVCVCVCVWVCVCVCVCVGVCVQGREREGGEFTREQFPAPGEIYCISSKMADAGESMGVYIRESIPRGSIPKVYNIKDMHNTHIFSSSFSPCLFTTSPSTKQAGCHLRSFSEFNLFRMTGEKLRTHTFFQQFVWQIYTAYSFCISIECQAKPPPSFSQWKCASSQNSY